MTARPRQAILGPLLRRGGRPRALGFGGCLAGLLLLGCARTGLAPAQLDGGTPPRPVSDDAAAVAPPIDARPARPGPADAGPTDTGPPCRRDRAVLPAGEVDVVFVIDRSSSMGWTLPDGVSTPWDLVGGAMRAVFADLDPRVGAGLVLFPGGTFCRLEEELTVSVGPGRMPAILDALDSDVIDGRSPITFALSDAYVSLVRQRRDTPDRFVVLLSDGGLETCGGDPFPEITVGDAHRDRGIDTFGIGVGGSVRSVTIQGGRSSYAVSHFEVLREILEQIEATLIGCVFAVPFEPSHPSDVTVRVGGERISYDPDGRDGWAWGGALGTSIHLHGSACGLRLATNAEVEAVVDCSP